METKIYEQHFDNRISEFTGKLASFKENIFERHYKNWPLEKIKEYGNAPFTEEEKELIDNFRKMECKGNYAYEIYRIPLGILVFYPMEFGEIKSKEETYTVAVSLKYKILEVE